MNVRLTVAALGLAALAGCSSPAQTAAPATPSPAGDDAFVLAAQADGWASTADRALVLQAGHAICGELDGGTTVPALVAQQVGNGLTGADAGRLTELAITDLCPGHLKDLPRK